jgi:cytochrome c-type biogenesis protein CcmI
MLWFVCAVVVITAFYFVLMPLFKEPKSSLDMELLEETEADRLLGRKAVVYDNLKDLEFEHKMGRLSESDFEKLREGYKTEEASLLQQLDLITASEKNDDIIEKDIASRKSRLYGSGARKAENASSCPACGATIIPGKKFCADCGKRL